MKTKVIITVDTEPSIAGAFFDPRRYSPLIHEPVWGKVGGTSHALGFLIRTLAEYGQVATFFVETAHTAYFSGGPMGQYVERLLDSGQDVQQHLHPCWRAFADNWPELDGPVSDQCHELETAQLAELLTQGRRVIKSWTGRRPVAMRTGNFSTGRHVFDAMAMAGLTISSNICLASYQPTEPELALRGGVHEFSGIRELPVTCFSDVGPIGRGRLRPFQITALSTAEQIAGLEQLNAAGGQVAVILTHPFEFVKARDFRYRNLRANRLVQRRLQQLCHYLALHTDMFEVVTLAEAASSIPGSVDEPRLTGSVWRSTVRAVQNAVNDRLP